MTAVSIIGIFLGLAVLIFCSMKGLSVFISALLASVVIALTGGISLESALLTDFMTGFVNFITGNFMVFAAGALMGKAYEITGGAKAVARLFIKLFTVRFAPYAIFLAIVVMTWGGIAGFVLAFSVFPIAVEIFREADLPRQHDPRHRNRRVLHDLQLGSGKRPAREQHLCDQLPDLPDGRSGSKHHHGGGQPARHVPASGSLYWTGPRQGEGLCGHQMGCARIRCGPP